jgi:hypothetical protein
MGLKPFALELNPNDEYDFLDQYKKVKEASSKKEKENRARKDRLFLMQELLRESVELERQKDQDRIN